MIVSSTLLCIITWYSNDTIKDADFSIDTNKHIIAIGPSTTACALKSDIIDGFQNLSRDGTAFDVIVPILPKILDDNPQIDTVWINSGRFQFKHMRGGTAATTNIQSFRDKMPLIIYGIDKQDIKTYISNENFFGAVLNPDPLKLCSRIKNPCKNLEYFCFQDVSTGSRYNLHNSSANWGIHWYDSVAIEHNGNLYTAQWIQENCTLSDYWTREAINICQERDIVPVLFCTPLYQYNRWCTKDGFAEYLESYDPKLLIADYEDFAFPSDSMYADVHHLNKYGAEYFSIHIKENGLKTETISDWLKRNGRKIE